MSSGDITRRAFIVAGATLGYGCGSAPAAPVSAPHTKSERAPSPSIRLALPERSSDALGGRALIRATEEMRAGQREQFFRDQYLAGNIPPRSRTLFPLQFAGGRLVLHVTRDYVALGSDTDFVRVPLAKTAAWAVARAADATLPTTRIVDRIYEESSCRVTSPRYGVRDEMATAALYLAHSEEVDRAIERESCAPDALIAGPKKDLVVSAREGSQPGRLAIYGWFRSSGAIIQPLSLVHSEQYVDYTHGIRLVSNSVFVDGVTRTFREVLHDRDLGPLISDEGSFTAPWGTIDEDR